MYPPQGDAWVLSAIPLTHLNPTQVIQKVFECLKKAMDDNLCDNINFVSGTSCQLPWGEEDLPFKSEIQDEYLGFEYFL
jgi:hypothetical protein